MTLSRTSLSLFTIVTCGLMTFAGCHVFDDPSGGGGPSSGNDPIPEDSGDPPVETYQTYEAFAEDYGVGVCQALDECGYLDEYGMTYDECTDFALDPWGGECDGFDGDAAWACMAEIWDLTCTGLEEPIPELCDQVCEDA